MPKYRVFVTEKVTYSVEVEAPDEDSAGQDGLHAVVKGEGELWAVSERTVTEINLLED